MAAARPADHTSRMESSRVRLSESRRLCRSTANIIRETRVTIERTLKILDSGPPNAPYHRQKRSLTCTSPTTAARLR